MLAALSSESEVTKAVKRLCSGQMHPENLKVLDGTGLPWFTRLCNVVRKLGKVQVERQTEGTGGKLRGDCSCWSLRFRRTNVVFILVVALCLHQKT